MKQSNHPSGTRPLAVMLSTLVAALAWSSHAQTSAPDTLPPGTAATGTQTPTPQDTIRPRSPDDADSYAWIPYTRSGYVGFNAGRPDWGQPCVQGFACDDSNAAYHLYTGGMFGEHFGAEIGYVDFGRATRAGGRTRAHGVNLALVGRAPVGRLDLFAKLGTLYGRTEVGASAASGAATGKASGWEASYGLGVGFHLSPRSSLVLEWNRYNLAFAGSGRRAIKTTSLGYVHRF